MSTQWRSTIFATSPFAATRTSRTTFYEVGIDYIQDLPEVDGFRNIFSARCYATKRVIFNATKDRAAKTAAECIFNLIVCKYGTPVEIVNDRGFMDSAF
jgi:hypothetical protein